VDDARGRISQNVYFVQGLHMQCLFAQSLYAMDPVKIKPVRYIETIEIIE
jgi:hypothetical protein